jgi:hypothetical protein
MIIAKEGHSAVKWIGEDYQAATEALRKLQAKLAEAPEEDWRASMAWEAIEDALQELGQSMFNAFELPVKPDKFRHWREKYTEDPL